MKVNYITATQTTDTYRPGETVPAEIHRTSATMEVRNGVPTLTERFEDQPTVVTPLPLVKPTTRRRLPEWEAKVAMDMARKTGPLTNKEALIRLKRGW